MAMLLLLMPWTAAPAELTATVESVQKIWDKDPHNAFTDLIRWKDRFVCCFRVGQKHVSDDGAIQLLESQDGVAWTPSSRITLSRADLRDPKLMVDVNGRLLVLAGSATVIESKPYHYTHAWVSEDGKNWSPNSQGWIPALAVSEANTWIWRVTSYNRKFYGWGYGTEKARYVVLFESPDGLSFDAITHRLLTDRGYPNETAMVIDNGEALSLLRRDGKAPDNTALLGSARFPFRDWTWRDLGVQIGGPALLRLPTGELLATVRLYTPKTRTTLCLLEPTNAKLHELLTLPSGGDCSYAGMVWHADRLWISYYSSHEGKSAIYLAKVRVEKTK